MLPFSHKTLKKYGTLLEARNLNLNAPPFFNLFSEGFSEVKNASAKPKPQTANSEGHSEALAQFYDAVSNATP